MARLITIKLAKSPIGTIRKHRETLRGLGLTKTNKVVVRKDTPEIRGMLRQVMYLIKILKVEEVPDTEG
ncbi:MAG TPA: 50S ribosomal protein L30 [Candidatus Limnocylindrales bacterium]|jgi:large subunit ribosomal protein L30|nr:50S ribosomal protein L30 [Candidatus Limnocylindrales bacterium]